MFVAADVCEPLWRAALAEVRVDPHVQADETSVRTQTRKERSFVWTFLSRVLTVYVFSASRSGDTPKVVLGGTRGALTIDGYTGYNVVTDVDGRERAGCWSHARRHVFDALATAPEAREGLDIILDLFMVERDAANANIVGTAAHLELRRTRSAPILERLVAWVNETTPLFEPKSPMGEALRYLKNQWSRLRVFLDDPLIPIHNNASEAAFRIVALMRKNSLFFGNERAGRRFMTLYSLIATCERHDVNPEVYLADVLIRIQDHPPTGSPNFCPTVGRRPSAPVSPSRGSFTTWRRDLTGRKAPPRSTTPRYARSTSARALTPGVTADPPPNPPAWGPLRRPGLDRRTDTLDSQTFLLNLALDARERPEHSSRGRLLRQRWTFEEFPPNRRIPPARHE